MESLIEITTKMRNFIKKDLASQIASIEHDLNGVGVEGSIEICKKNNIDFSFLNSLLVLKLSQETQNFRNYLFYFA